MQSGIFNSPILFKSFLFYYLPYLRWHLHLKCRLAFLYSQLLGPKPVKACTKNTALRQRKQLSPSYFIGDNLQETQRSYEFQHPRRTKFLTPQLNRYVGYVICVETGGIPNQKNRRNTALKNGPKMFWLVMPPFQLPAIDQISLVLAGDCFRCVMLCSLYNNKLFRV